MILDKIFRIIADSLWNSTIQVHKVDDKNNVSFVDMARSDYLNQIKEEIKLTLWNNAFSNVERVYLKDGNVYLDIEDASGYNIDRINAESLFDVALAVKETIEANIDVEE